ncbi:TetR/AcrR family transcriptional regulator [Streptomyces lunaelactis]|uniref:TetR/AcrR family transcriptional regulator n=1 Tax=Streptomyces lunaelactis TaxID=1535768 RepID=A0A2R4T8V1_9ACTN|nr:TetR/AcrR family transcriptional regulator [Streptomyces lunaelactis]AVZ75563.1 TetR/AcrR family transcriptional regulator [Streptomyces lunaelactis]NUK09484.1 TetR/AcrR family transcriptional regulator [Streptomyces lunaelactis]NUK73361.1 TetR/AcrR family transcriptional regulator [Streptomyces lunaelactis]NUK89744.1 TetR/AcrR family transcriptional regulator [Streptomyces lunaelactis]NUL10932.1 TetR/AcrR family transcriptional regulator [Streptomyces lunaelactis]
MATGPDRRVRKTRQALHFALVQLMMEKGYESVTVRDIIERADVGRTTFYAHFTDKEDLLRHGVENLQDELREAGTARPAGTGRFFAFSLPLLEHAYDNRHLSPLLVGRRGGPLLRRWFDEMVADLAREELSRRLPARHPTRVPLATVVPFVAGGFASLLTWWIDDGLQYRPTELDEMFHAVAVPGVRDALNL